MERMRAEFKRAQQLDELDERLFTPGEWRTVQNLINRADGHVSLLKSFRFIRAISPYVPDWAKPSLLAVAGKVYNLAKKLKNKLR